MKLKKILIALAIFFGLIIGAIIAAPFLFKDQIKATIDEQIAANLNADVLFDIDNFSISLLPNFPNLTVSVKELGIIGRDEFAGKKLFGIKEFAVEVNLKKLLFDDQMSIQSIDLVQPEIFIKVLKDGKANYDITIASDEEAVDTTTTESDDFTIAIEKWSISDGHLIYDDETLATYIELLNLNHSGSGNFSLSVFDLSTQTDVLLKQITYDGDSYLGNRQFAMDMILNMDLDQMKFTFKENKVSLNDFSFGFEGWLAMPADDIDMDLSFASKDNTFKSLISLIPAMYTEDFSDLKSSGTVRFDGFAKGIYNDNSLPAYSVNLEVNDGMFQYPDLPEAVSNVGVKMLIASNDGNIDHTKIDISNFHIEFGQEPFDGFLKIDNLINYPIDMGIKTTLNLSNLSKLFPTEGLDMAGIFKADFKAKGVYDSVKAIIPKIEATMSLEGGQIVSADLPAPLNNFNFSANIDNTTGKLNDTKVSVPSITLDIDGSPIKGVLLLDNMDDMHWEAALEGNLMFDKLFPIIDKVYPMPGTEMGGAIGARFKTEGKMSDVDAERYERLTTSGLFTFNNFTYTDSVSLPQGLTIQSGEFSFTPKSMKVKDVKTIVGKSDFVFNGSISNYIKYIFNDNETISGTLALKSNKIDVNEWMVEEETATGEEESSEPYAIIEVPKNIDFVMQANINEVIYDNLTMNNVKGKIIVKNGVLYFDNLQTSTLGGAISFNGNYDTRDLNKPTFDMKLDAASIGIKQSYAAFNTVQTLAPLANNVTGDVSSVFSLSGVLQPDMMPQMSSLNGSGLLKIAEAELGNSKLVSGLTSYFKGMTSDKLDLKNISMFVNIENGRLKVKPFDMKINNYNANIGGSTGVDGSMDYSIKMDVPAGKLGSQVNKALGSLTGTENSSENIKVNLGLSGTYDSPKIDLIGTDTKEQVTKAAVDKTVDLVKENTGVELPASKEELNKEAVAKARKEADSILADAQKQADKVKEEAKKTAEMVRAEAKTQSDQLLKNAGSNPFKVKAAEIAGKKLIKEAESKASKIESEGNKQADAIMAKAQKQADTLIKNAENK